ARGHDDVRPRIATAGGTGRKVQAGDDAARVAVEQTRERSGECGHTAAVGHALVVGCDEQRGFVDRQRAIDIGDRVVRGRAARGHDGVRARITAAGRTGREVEAGDDTGAVAVE